MNRIKGFKTLAFAVAIGLASALSTPEVQFWVAANMTWAGPALGTAIVVLRAFTTSPIFKDE
jgi:hypothetical protein